MKSLTIVAVFLLLAVIHTIQAVIYEKHCLIFEESYDFDESRVSFQSGIPFAGGDPAESAM